MFTAIVIRMLFWTIIKKLWHIVPIADLKVILINIHLHVLSDFMKCLISPPSSCNNNTIDKDNMEDTNEFYLPFDLHSSLFVESPCNH